MIHSTWLGWVLFGVVVTLLLVSRLRSRRAREFSPLSAFPEYLAWQARIASLAERGAEIGAEGFANLLCDEFRTLLPGEGGVSLFLREPSRSNLRRFGSSGEAPSTLGSPEQGTPDEVPKEAAVLIEETLRSGEARLGAGVGVFPVSLGRQGTGTLVVTSPGWDFGGEETTWLLESAAIWFATTLRECLRLADDAERTIQLSIVNQIGKIAASKRTPSDLLETTVRLLSQRFGYDHVCFALLAPLGGEILSWAESGKRPGFLLKGKDLFRLAGSPFYRAATTGATVIHSDVAEVEGFVDVRGGETKAEVAVPILSAGEVIAVLNVASATPGILSEGDARALERIRGWLAVAITNSLYVEELNRANQEALWAREQAEEQKRRLELTLRSIPDGVFVLDSSEKVILLNQRAEELLACDEETVLGKNLLEIVEVEGLRLLLREAIESPGQVARGEFILEGDGGAPEARRVIEGCIDTELYNSGGEMGTLAILRDVTRDRELESMKSEFLANVSHELRTPLTSVIGFSQLLGDEELGEINEVQRECIERVTNQGRHLLNIINSLLDLSRLKAKKTALSLESVSLLEVADETIANLSSLSSEKGITVGFVGDDDLPLARVDRGKISQVLINLLNNAIKFTPPQGSVTVEVKRAGSFIEVAVLDTGPGIPAEHLEFIFDRFHRVGNVPGGTAAGTGLGLTIVKELVELHEGGKVSVSSRLGAGSRFAFRVAAEPKPRPREGPIRIGHLPLRGHLRLARLAKLPLGDGGAFSVKGYRGVVDLALEFRRGRVDGAVLPLPEGLRLISGGSDIVAVAVVHREDGSLLSRQLGSLDELDQGAVVGVPGLGSNEQMFLERVLDSSGLRVGQVVLATAGWEDGLQRLEDGRWTAAVLPEPFASRARERGARELQRASAALPGFPSSALFVRRALLEDRRDDLRLLVDRMVEVAVQNEEGVDRDQFVIRRAEVGTILSHLDRMGTFQEKKKIDLERCVEEEWFEGGEAKKRLRALGSRSEGKGAESSDVDLRSTPEGDPRTAPDSKEEGGATGDRDRDPDRQRVGHRVLLVVDDRPEVLSLISVKFRRDFEVLTATNGKEAIEVAGGETRPDLILMDMMMPEMDGLEATRVLKSNPKTRSIPIWAFTANVMTEDFVEAREAGCTDVVTKPFEPRMLLAKVRGFFGDQPEESSSSGEPEILA